MEPATSQTASPRYGDALPVITALALLVLAWLALSATWTRNDEIRAQVTEELQAELRGHVNAWELGLQRHLDDAKFDVRQASDLSEVQGRLRRRRPWFDSLYTWTPRGAGFDGEERPGVFHFPLAEAPQPHTDPAARTEQVEGDACVEHATRALIAEPAMLPPCVGASTTRAVRASNNAAEQLLLDGRTSDAMVVLVRASFADLGPLGKWHRDLAMLTAVARHRTLMAKASLTLGDPANSRRVLSELARDTATIDAPSLERTLPLVQQALAQLEAVGQDTAEIRSLLTPAEIRADAWRELQALLTREPSRTASEGPRFIHHLHRDQPWTLYVIPPDASGRWIGMLLLPSRLHEDFLRVDAGDIHDDITLRDSTGRYLAGARAAEVMEGTEVKFTFALRNETVAFTRTAADVRIEPLMEQWWTLRNLVTAFCIILGYGALASYAKAERQQRELTRRQREFTTRVTHELKTPLAGIKVMAENLAAGAFRDEAQREHMADRIISEADRLAARVNEILNLGREPIVAVEEPFDLEEIILEAIDEWGPRYEEADVQLHADVDPVDPIPGDPRAIRDAIGSLLDNALKYRREDVASQVWLDVRGVTGAVELLVTDNGLGVPLAERKRIFERFVRVEGPNRGKAGGHGLGLSQVAATVAAHRGSVVCEDGIDGGARFRIRLPAPTSAR